MNTNLFELLKKLQAARLLLDFAKAERDELIKGERAKKLKKDVSSASDTVNALTAQAREFGRHLLDSGKNLEFVVNATTKQQRNTCIPIKMLINGVVRMLLLHLG